MEGTILITGANGSLAIPMVEHLLTHRPARTLVLTVRRDADNDANTARLRQAVACYKADARVSIRELDLADLGAVTQFAATIAAEVAGGQLPALAAIVCNAYHWNLVRAKELTGDGLEKTLQVNHVAQAALILRLLGSFGSGDGRIVVFSSDAITPGKNSLEKYAPAIPANLEDMARPPSDPAVDDMGYGFQRYANSKLATVMWSYALNRYLEKDPKLARITAVAINPGNLADSRALYTNTPRMLQIMSWLVIGPLWRVLRLMDPTMRPAADAAADVAQFATNVAHPSVRGYFTLSKPDDSSKDSHDETKQQQIWVKTAQWAGLGAWDTALQAAYV